MNPTPIDPKITIEWLNKLVMMAQWPGKLPFHLVRLYGAPEQYQKFLLQVRTGATDNTDDTDQIVKTAREKLLEAVAKWPALKELFAGAEDPFASAPVERLQLLSDVSDITTDPQRMLWSRNGTFVAVLEALRQSQDFEPEALTVDWLNKFFELLETEATIAEMLYNLAAEPYWLIVLASLRDGRDYTGDEEQIVTRTLREWQAKLTNDFRALLFKPAHLSRAPAKLIRMAWNNQQLFAEARKSIPADKRGSTPEEERKQVVNESLKLFKEKATDDYLEIEGDLIVLATVARHYINVRKFAKLDGFVYTWPDIARLAMSNYPALEYVEDLLVNRKPRPTDADLDTREARDLYELCSRNDRLIRFLRLRPRFAEIDDDELRRYRPLAPVVISEASVKSASGAAGAPSPLEFAPPSPPSTLTKSLNCVLDIVRLSGADAFSTGDEFTYKVSLELSGDEPQTTRVSGSVEKLLKRITTVAVGGEGDLLLLLRDLLANSPIQAESRMAAGGSAILDGLLSPVMQNHLRGLLSKYPRLRLIVKSTDPEIHFLPWEWLPGLSPTQLLLSAPDPSIVRDASPATPATQSVFLLAPLRLLSIIPPAPIGRRFSGDHTAKALENLTVGEAVDYKSLVREEATVENIQKMVKSFQPDVIHFDGHITFSSDVPDVHALQLYLAGESKASTPDLARFMKENGVHLLVFGRNSMAQMFQNIGARAALLFAQEGFPAVLAPMRAIDDAFATTFTTEFYRAFLQGNNIESALQIARRKLASRGADWSAFALFADPNCLDYLQLARGSA